ncbi:MAG: hypothetical protein CMG09_03495 [Candidatus Marinimicrobia bacterium]|nr:hypothetical protein [Candidatus Neomarinimicrobiota bacterium]|tara:strand:- start:998 stop:1342 length:345 start_codon:yes stop_codon:yes gene_type:complete
MKIDDKEINFDSKDMTDEMKKEFKKTGKIHIEKTGDDGEDVKIDVDKNKKTVDVNVNEDGKKTNVKIGLSGIKVVENGKQKVNIQFWPIFLFITVVISAVLFTLYKIVELIVRG